MRKQSKDKNKKDQAAETSIPNIPDQSKLSPFHLEQHKKSLEQMRECNAISNEESKRLIDEWLNE